MLSNLQSQVYASRYRPDRYDFELEESKKSWHDLTARAIKSILQDNWICLKEDKRVSKRMQKSKDAIRSVCLLGCMIQSMYYLECWTDHRIKQIDLSNKKTEQNIFIRTVQAKTALQKRIDNCSTNLDFAIQECIYTKYHNVQGFTSDIKQADFEDYKKESVTKSFSPTSPNRYLIYPIVPYQKPQYYVWQEGNYRECKTKSE